MRKPIDVRGQLPAGGRALREMDTISHAICLVDALGVVQCLCIAGDTLLLGRHHGVDDATNEEKSSDDVEPHFWRVEEDR